MTPFIRFNRPTGIIATLGLEPQIITRSLDCFQHMGETISHVTVIHTDLSLNFRPRGSWQTFIDFQRYVESHYPDIGWEWVLLQEGEVILSDVRTPEDADLVFRVIYKTMQALKQRDLRLHGVIAGGRKSIIVYTLLSAQLLFDPEDQLWHLFSPLDTRDPHVSPEVSRLVEIEIMHLSGLMPMVHQMLIASNDPTAAMGLYKKQHNMDKLVKLRTFWQRMDPVDQNIIKALVQGYGMDQVPNMVGYSESAVRGRIKRLADSIANNPAYGRVSPNRPSNNREFLVDHFRPLLSQMGG